MTPFWILLFIICLPKTGSIGENPADHGHYTHDAAMISRLHYAHHFWRQGHQTFSGFIKARERPKKKEGHERQRTKKTQGRKKRKETEKQRKKLRRPKTQTNKKRNRETEEEAAAIGQPSITIVIAFAFTPQLHQPQQLFHTAAPELHLQQQLHQKRSIPGEDHSRNKDERRAGEAGGARTETKKKKNTGTKQGTDTRTERE